MATVEQRELGKTDSESPVSTPTGCPPAPRDRLRRLVIGTLAVGCLVSAPTTAAAAPQPPAAPGPPASSQAHAASLESTVCGLATLAQSSIGDAVNLALETISKGEIHTTFVGSLVAGVAVKDCPAAINGLAKLIGALSAKRPSVRPLLGPVVYQPQVRLEASVHGPTETYADVSWRSVDPSAAIRSYFVWYRAGFGPWIELGRTGFSFYGQQFFNRGETLQFAVRAADAAGNLSPWAYTAFAGPLA
jgi:hypothetical protein